MLLLLFLVALTVGAASFSEEQKVQLLRGDCPMFWFSFRGRCYKYVATDMTFGEAELSCVSQGANLVSIHSQEEHNFVNSLIANFDPAQGMTWIGLTDIHKEGGWIWTDGSKMNFAFWNPGEPNNANGPEPCVHTNHGTAKKWNDTICSNRFPFVCASRRICP